MDYQHEVIFCIVNAGYTDAVMEAARSFGARGGTVIHARGTANPQAESKFNITVQPEKEIVMILVEREVKDDILHALYKAIGLQTAGQGIAFCMPVEDVVGLAPKAEEQPQKETKSTEVPKNNQKENKK
ncbi:MAG: P-II family nitrogen regulator [Candidatus Fimimonas sp.]